MNEKVLTLQDISCYGQCSLTVALPIISSYGIETIILPSALLSTHTSGFKNYTFLDLTEEIKKIINHYKELNLKFDCIYSGYLGSIEQIDILLDLYKNLLSENGVKIVDPVMGDKGKLYPAFNNKFVFKMKELIKEADIIIPNITEACFLTNVEYKEKYDEKYIKKIIQELKNIGAKNIVLTGVSFNENKLGVYVSLKNEDFYYEHEKINKEFHGTGDVYSSAFVGEYMNDRNIYKASQNAANFVVDSIKNTMDDPNHSYGVKFEKTIKNKHY